MANPYRAEKTPVLIFFDLPRQVQIDDDDKRLIVDMQRLRTPHRIAAIRCQARARGDTALATYMKIPVDGGYRCRARAVANGCGLCKRHEKNATPAVIFRATALYVREYVRTGRVVDPALTAISVAAAKAALK